MPGKATERGYELSNQHDLSLDPHWFGSSRFRWTRGVLIRNRGEASYQSAH